MARKLKEMADYYEEMDLTIFEMLDLLNTTTGKVLDFKKDLTCLDKEDDAKKIGSLVKKAEGLLAYIQEEAKSLVLLEDYAEYVVKQAKELQNLAKNRLTF